MKIKIKTPQGIIVFLYQHTTNGSILVTKNQNNIKKNMSWMGYDYSNPQHRVTYFKFEGHTIVTLYHDNKYQQLMITPSSNQNAKMSDNFRKFMKDPFLFHNSKSEEDYHKLKSQSK